MLFSFACEAAGASFARLSLRPQTFEGRAAIQPRRLAPWERMRILATSFQRASSRSGFGRPQEQGSLAIMNGNARIALRRLLMSAGVCLVAAVAPAHAELDVAKLKSSIQTSVEADYPKLDALYKDLHAHPEVAFQEVKTAAKLAAEMRALGFQVTEKVGKTGLVAIYENGAGPSILVRTELDALPMEEKTGLPYASRDKTDWNGQETFVDHSCGHDIHMASWVGTAKTLIGLKDQWHGTLMFIAQPAEEIGAGAQAMLADGVFTRFPKPDFGFALHDGAFAYGSINYRVGRSEEHTSELQSHV